MTISPLFRLLRGAALILPFTLGTAQADWILTGGPGATAGRTETIFAKGTEIYAATNDEGVFRSADKGAAWTAINDGLGIYLSIDCMASIDNTLFAGAYTSGIYRSEDDGKTWTASNSGVTNTQPRAFALKGSTLFIATYGGGVFRSTDKGLTWKPASTGITDYFLQTMILSGSDLYAGTQTGVVYHSSDDGDSWTSIRSATGSSNGVTALAAIGSKLFAGTKGNGVYVTSDMGATWKAANTGMTTGNIHAMTAVDGDLFTGTSYGYGVFHSSDGGANWTPENDGLTDTDLQSIVAIGSDLYAGTNGKVWRRPLSEFGVVGLTPMAAVSAGSGFAPGLAGSVRSGDRIGFRLAKAARIDLSAFGMDGRKAATLAHGPLPAGDYQPIVAAGLPAGLYCFRLQIDGTRFTKTMRLE